MTFPTALNTSPKDVHPDVNPFTLRGKEATSRPNDVNPLTSTGEALS